jgi:hypothetical protein
MEKTVAIHQPTYVPYMGFFRKMIDSDIFIFYDDAPYSKTANQDWNTIKCSDGSPHRIKVPIDRSNGDRLVDIRTKDYIGWKEKHLKTVQMNYARAPYFQEVFAWYEDALLVPYESIADMNVSLLTDIATQIFDEGFPELALSSAILPGKEDTGTTERLVELVMEVGGTHYLSGAGGKHYLRKELFWDEGMMVSFSTFDAVEYPQLWNSRGGFLPNMSVLDYLMNCGFTNPEGIAWKRE